jgi:hypothetical protein
MRSYEQAADFSRCSRPSEFDVIRGEEKNSYENEAKDRLHIGLMTRRDCAKYPLRTRFDRARDEGKFFVQNGSLDLGISEMETIRKRRRRAQGSTSSHNIRKIELAPKGNINAGHQ